MVNYNLMLLVIDIPTFLSSDCFLCKSWSCSTAGTQLLRFGWGKIRPTFFNLYICGFYK